MSKRKEVNEQRSAEIPTMARAIAGDQLLQVADLERVLYWLERYGNHVERSAAG